MQKRILCYGDSNTFGYVPAGNGRRYPALIRWPGILRSELGESYEVIEEGCSGRTTDLDSPGQPWKNGRAYLYTSLHTHKPLGMVILMLGTNDLKTIFHRDENDIGNAVREMIIDTRAYFEMKREDMPKIFLLSPAPLGKGVSSGIFKEDFSEQSYEVSLHLSGVFRRIAEDMDCLFLDLGEFCEVSSDDDVHMTELSHILAGKRISECVHTYFEENRNAWTDDVSDFRRPFPTGETMEKLKKLPEADRAFAMEIIARLERENSR